MNESGNLSCQGNSSLHCNLPRDQLNVTSFRLVAIFILLTATLVVVFNGIILVLVVKERKIRMNPYHFLVLVLSVSDFVVGLSIISAVLREFIPGAQMNKGVTILNALLITVGIYMSLYHTFLISLHRCLVICTENWSPYVFGPNRKYFVCVSGWIAILIFSCSLISPDEGSLPIDNVNTFYFAFKGHYRAYLLCVMGLTVLLISSTVILYLVTIAHVYRTYRPTGQSNASRAIYTIDIPTTESHSSENTCTSSSEQDQVNVRPARTCYEQSNRMATRRRKKVVGTLQLVGILILVLLMFTGPLVVTLPWFDTIPPKVRGVLCGLFGINSMLNPYIYMWKLKDIRAMVKSTLCCFCR